MISLEQKVKVYERVLHLIQMHSMITMSQESMMKIIDSINAWSYAHRMGNGELSEEEQQAQIDHHFYKLAEL